MLICCRIPGRLAYAVFVNAKNKNRKKPSDRKNQKVVRKSYTPISDALSQVHSLADNEISDGLKRYNLGSVLQACMGRKRRSDGIELNQILMALLIWPFLNAPSLHCFCSELCQFLRAASGCVKHADDLIYNFWKRTDINWRRWYQVLIGKLAKDVDLGPEQMRAFVVDDSLKERRGKKVEGTSRHYDHNRGISVIAHQLLELGLAGVNGFLPLDGQICMGKTQAVDKDDFKDNRCAPARDLRRARSEDKHEMLARMLSDAIKAGHKAKYLIADAWFGCKRNIATALKFNLQAIFQMKRGKLKYRVGDKEKSAKELYQANQRKMKAVSAKARYKTCRIQAEINLQTEANKPAKWQEVVLILSAPNDGAHDNWVIFLSTDIESTTEHLFEIYALRWSIEVYFKEIKQNFGFLAEQSGKYQVAYASVHCSAARYVLIFAAMLNAGNLSYGEVRDLQSGKLLCLSYAALLWQLFRAIITGALESLKEEVGESTVAKVTEALDGAVEAFLSKALQITPTDIQIMENAEASGNI